MANPQVLLLGEPYAGFDWDTYQRFWELVARRREAGSSVLIISHFLAGQERFNRIIDLRDGKTGPRCPQSCSSAGSWPSRNGQPRPWTIVKRPLAYGALLGAFEPE